MRHLREAEPSEGCGLLLGRRVGEQAVVTRIQPAANVAPDPRTAYEVDPRALLQAYRASREAGPEVLGAFHSHPRSDARPSPRDHERAWPGLLYLILGSDGEMRCWRLEDGSFVEVPTQVEAEGPPPGGGREAAIVRLSLPMTALATLYLAAAGLFLLVFPWTPLWDSNVFVHMLTGGRPGGWAELVLRWLVTFYGALHLSLAVEDLWRALRRRHGEGE